MIDRISSTAFPNEAFNNAPRFYVGQEQDNLLQSELDPAFLVDLFFQNIPLPVSLRALLLHSQALKKSLRKLSECACPIINCCSCAQALISELHFTLGKGNNGDEVEDKCSGLWPVKLVREDSQRNEDEEDVDLCGKEDGLEALEERQVRFVAFWASS